MSDRELTLEPTDPQRRPKRSHKPAKAIEDMSPTVRIEMVFKESFQRRYGCPIDGPGVGSLLYKPARDRKIFKDLIADVGELEAKALVHDFFFTFDRDRHIRFMTRSGDARDFKRCLERLFMLRNGKVHDAQPDRIMDNDAEIDRARRPRR